MEASRLLFGGTDLRATDAGAGILSPETTERDEPAWVELVRAAENYVEICLTSGKQYLHRATLTSLQKPLEAEGLVRVHRSTIVNVRFLQRRLSRWRELGRRRLGRRRFLLVMRLPSGQ